MAGGRPLKFKSAEELQDKIDEYFAYCDNRMTNIYSKELGDNIQINIPAPYTMSGLAYALDIDRRTLLNYSKKDEFFPTIKKARAKVEEFAETQLYEGKSPAGVIFNLKNNFEWKDKSEVDNTHRIKTALVEFIDGRQDKDSDS